MSFTMKRDVRSGLILLLHLTACSCHLELSQTSSNLQRDASGPVHLECRAIGSGLMDHGVFWFRQRKSIQSPEPILYLSSASKLTQTNKTTYAHFKPSKGISYYMVEINPFRENDQGTYYCMINKNQLLYISPGIPLYYPTASTPINTPAKPLGTENPCIFTRSFLTTEPTQSEVLPPALLLYTSLQLGKLCFAALVIILSMILCPR